MLSINFTKVFNSIRFKLTLIYSTIILLFGITILAIMNIYLVSSLRGDPRTQQPTFIMMRQFPSVEKLTDIELQNIRDIRENDLKNFQTISLFTLIPLTAISFFIGYYVSGSFLQPISDLSNKISKLKTSELGSKLPVETDDEVGSLIKSFNNMSSKLKGSFDAQLKFVQDASHELKTPLTIIHTSLDTTLADKNAKTEELHEAMTDALDGVKRLQKITNDLLALTTPYELNEIIDIGDLVNSQIENLKPLAQEKRVELKYVDNSDAQKIKGNSIQLGRAIYNVIENGIKYSNRKESVVETIVNKDNEKITIIIKDNGIGIPEKIKGKVFQRFFRGSKSEEGNGLGLSLSKEIIENHSGTINFDSSSQGTSFIIILPI